MAETDKVRVRVAVAVDDRGNYYACGYTPGYGGESKESTDRLLMKGAQNALHGGIVRLVWLEANVALPTFEALEAEVTEEGIVENE